MSPAIIDILLSMHMKEKRFIFLSPQVGPDKKSFYKYRLTPDTYLLYIVEIVENKGLVPLEEIEVYRPLPWVSVESNEYSRRKLNENLSDWSRHSATI